VPEPTPVLLGGLRFEAPPWTRSRGLPQNGGYVSAVDVSSGVERWITKIYDALPDHGKEVDKRDVFITVLKAAPDASSLLVTDERGRRFQLNLVSLRVTHLQRDGN